MVRVAIVAATRTIAFKSGAVLFELAPFELTPCEVTLCGAVLSGVVLLEFQLQLL